MSAFTVRPQVLSISSQLADGLLNGLDACAGLAASTSKSVGQALAATEAWAASTTAPGTSAPILARAEADRRAAATAQLTGLDAVGRVQAVAFARAGAYYVPSAEAHADALRALTEARTAPAAQAAADQLLADLDAAHTAAFEARLVQAVEAAGRSAGFAAVTVRTRDAGPIVVEAVDVRGVALVTEVRTDAEGPALSTEVVGLHDGSCQAHLDAFDAALEAEGVRAAAPRRHTTGGVAALDAARHFVGRRYTKKAKTAAPQSDTAPNERRRPTTRRQRTRR